MTGRRRLEYYDFEKTEFYLFFRQFLWIIPALVWIVYGITLMLDDEYNAGILFKWGILTTVFGAITLYLISRCRSDFE